MKFKSLHARNKNLTIAEVLKIERLEKRIQLIIALAEARAGLRSLKFGVRMNAREEKAVRERLRREKNEVKREKAARVLSKDAPGLIVPAPVLLRRLGLAAGAVLPFDCVPDRWRHLAVGESAGSDWTAEVTARSLPPDLYRVDPGPPVMVTRIAPDPTEPELDVPAGELDPAPGAQVAPETAPA